MTKPTGKLAHAYRTIAAQEERIEQLEAELARAQLPTAGGAVPEAYKCTPKKGGEPFVIRRAPDSWELRECDIEVVRIHPDDGETDQSIAADCYWHIADVMGTEPCWSVQEHIEFMRETMEDAATYLGSKSGSDQSDKLTELSRRIGLCLSGAAPGYTPRLFAAAPHPVSGEQSELDEYRFAHIEIDGLLMGAVDFDITHEGNYKAALLNTLGALRKLIGNQTAAQDVSGLCELIDDVCEWFELSGLHELNIYKALKEAHRAQAQGGKP